MSRAQLTSTDQQNSGGAVAPFLAGKNKIINGDFGVNQRAFSSNTSNAVYMFDRWFSDANAGSGTVTFSAQTFTAGSAPVAGYEGTNYMQVAISGATGSNYASFSQRIENVRTFANQTITISFWAKAAAGTPQIYPIAFQRFGSGGSPSTSTATGGAFQAITTSWARYSWTITLPSIAGKTIGTNNDSSVEIELMLSQGGAIGLNNTTFSIWGVQVEAGSVATPFTTASGTLQGELALCQRYYWRWASTASSLYAYAGTGFCSSTTQFKIKLQPPVTMRTPISASISNATNMQIQTGNTSQNVTSASADQPIPDSVGIIFNVSSGLTTGNGGIALANNSSAPYIELSAEL